MGKLLLVLATVLLSGVFAAGQQVKPSAEIGRVTVQVPLLSNGKPVMTEDKDMVEVAQVMEVKPGKPKPVEPVVVPLAKVRNMRAAPDTMKPHVMMGSSTSQMQPVVVPEASTTTSPAVLMKGIKSCHQLLLASALPTPMPVPATPVENCEMLCTKFELMPICAHNGVCIHEFPNQCVMDTFNCKHRDLAFRAVDESICSMGLCSRRCTEEDLKM